MNIIAIIIEFGSKFSFFIFFSLKGRRPRTTLFPYATLFRSASPTPAIATTRCNAWRRCPTPCSRSEEHTSELQSRRELVCRLLLEKKKVKMTTTAIIINFASKIYRFIATRLEVHEYTAILDL